MRKLSLASCSCRLRAWPVWLVMTGVIFFSGSALAFERPAETAAGTAGLDVRIDGAPVEDLLALYQRALENDPKLRAARFEYEAAREAVPQAIAGLLPDASASISSIRSSQKIISSDNEVFASGSTSFRTRTDTLTITQPLFDWKTLVGVFQARADVRRATVAFEQARQDLIIRVSERYLAVLLADDRLAFARAELTAVESDFALAEGRHSMGLAPVTDLLDARARLASVRATEIEACNQLDDARQALEEVCGFLYGGQARLERAIPMQGPDPAELESWLAASREQNLDIIQKRHEVEAARQEVRRQRAGHLPTLEAVGSYEREDTGGTLFGGGSDVEARDIGMRVNVPLFAGGEVRSFTRQAQNLYRAALMDQERIRREVERETRAAFLGVQTAISRAEALEQSVAAQQLVVEAKQRGFRSGLYTSLAVLDAQRDLYRARQDHAEARYDYLLNSLRLKRTIGTLSESDLLMINQWLVPGKSGEQG